MTDQAELPRPARSAVPPPTQATRPADRFLVVLLLGALAAWMVRAHWEGIDQPHLQEKLRLHAAVLENTAPAPAQYDLWAISQLMEGVHELTGIWLEFVLFGNIALSLLILVFLNHEWLRTWWSPKTALVGGFLLGALTGILFLHSGHHPYEYWSVAFYALLLMGMARDWSLKWLVPIALLGGLAGEKHAVLAVLWVLWSWQRGRPIGKTFQGGLLLFGASLLIPIVLRLTLGMDRLVAGGHVTLAAQHWGRIAWTMTPYVLPFFLILLLRKKMVPMWVRWLWLTVPLGFAATLGQGYQLDEVRALWLFVPVFTATFCAWIAYR